jgi:glycosyltransferase involved in cell wall biosynthesis
VSGEAKDTLLQGADVFVLPSASENFGIAVAEAMVSGLPVLVTSGVDLAKTVQTLHAGRVCEPEVNAIAEGLRAMLQAPASYDQREQLRSAAAAHFSWAQNAQALNRLYSSLSLNPQ